MMSVLELCWFSTALSPGNREGDRLLMLRHSSCFGAYPETTELPVDRVRHGGAFDTGDKAGYWHSFLCVITAAMAAKKKKRDTHDNILRTPRWRLRMKAPRNLLVLSIS
mmetsp:Transcript_5325/g.7075  ORF Transcript_5325/g.7075 Transcript_5325/m.7075 type:complete len:109 (+) Transcript_5325:1550-1876(+)